MAAHADIPVVNLRVGDILYTSHGKVIPVTSLGIARGCRNLHVNKTMCFDRAGFATVTFERGAS
jgi:hypothetical protein